MVVLVVRGSGEGRVLALRRHYARLLVESGRDYTKAPEDGREQGTFRGPSDDQDDYGPTTTSLKTVADHFFGTRPSEDWGDRARSSREGIG